MYVTDLIAESLWDLWWHGNLHLRIGPYRKIKGSDLQNKNDRTALSKANFVIKKLVSVVQHHASNSTQNFSLLSPGELDEIFKNGFTSFLRELYPNKLDEDIDTLQKNDSSFITLYDLAKKSSNRVD